MNKTIISDAVLKTIRIIWLSMFMSLSCFLTVILIIPPNEELPATSEMLYVFAALSLLFLGMSFVIPFMLFTKPLKARTLPPNRVAGAFNSTRIISFALCEAIATLGLALHFITKQPMVSFPFLALGAVGLMLHFPRQPKLD